MKKKNKPSNVRAHVYYAGRVQGVGFRFTAERLALEQGLRGWVKNLPDGRVELVCEAPKADLEALLKNIQESMLGRTIKNADCTWLVATNEFTDFSVEYYL